MDKMRRILAFFLALVLLISIVPMDMAVQAAATSNEAAEAGQNDQNPEKEPEDPDEPCSIGLLATRASGEGTHTVAVELPSEYTLTEDNLSAVFSPLFARIDDETIERYKATFSK